MCPNTRRSHNGEFEARRPCQIAVLSSRMLCLRIISRQHDALTGAASCVRFVLRTGPARAGKAHGDMCDGIGPIGACPRPAHASRGRSAGRPLSMGARKSRFCACPQRAVRCARDSGPSPIPCQVPGLKIQPLSRAHGRRTLCLRERRKPDFSRFSLPHCVRAGNVKFVKNRFWMIVHVFLCINKCITTSQGRRL